MARVEIEERAWSDPRLKSLAHELKTTQIYAMGVLAALWHDTQEQLKEVVDERQLRVWFAAETTRYVDVIRALEVAGYVEKTAEGLYKIDGNSSRLERIRSYKRRSKAANKERWLKSKNTSDIKGTGLLQGSNKESYKDPTRTPQGGFKESPTYNMQHATDSYVLLRNTAPLDVAPPDAQFLDIAESSCEAPTVLQNDQVSVSREEIVCPWDDPIDDATTQTEEWGDVIDVTSRQTSADASTIHGTGSERPKTRSRKKSSSKSVLDVSEGKDAKRKIGADQVIAFYVEQYRERFNGQTPMIGPRNGRAAKEALQTAGSIERTKELISAYLRMDDKWFWTRRYDLVTFNGNLNSIAMFADKGVVVTSSMAGAMERHGNNKAVAERVIAKYSGA